MRNKPVNIVAPARQYQSQEEKIAAPTQNKWQDSAYNDGSELKDISENGKLEDENYEEYKSQKLSNSNASVSMGTEEVKQSATDQN